MADEADDRGRLEISDHVVERIAVLAAGEVAGVASVGSTLEGAVGRRYPKARARVAGHRARLTVEVAVTWPFPLPQVSADVRDHVTARLQDLAGVAVDSLDVTASKIVHRRPETTRRVQ